VPCRRERRTCSFALVLVERSPLWPVIDPLLVDDEATLLADGEGQYNESRLSECPSPIRGT